jgi:hypothetical protein
MRAFEGKVQRERERSARDFANGSRAAAAEADKSDKLPTWLIGLPQDLFSFLWPIEELEPESKKARCCSASQPKPTTRPSVATFERILNVLKQLTGDAPDVSPATRLPLLVDSGRCLWQYTSLAVDASWFWCRGTLFTSLHILKAHDIDAETHFWAVVSTMLIISHAAEEMVPILDWACRVAGRYHHDWLGARHELPCLLYLLLFQPDSRSAATTNGTRSELVRTINYFSSFNPLQGRSRPTRETSEQRAVIDLVLGSGSVVNVKAYAGTGKTSTALKQQKRIEGNGLMILYNKSAQEDAAKRLNADSQHHVIVKTLDALVTSHTAGTTRRRHRAPIRNVNTELVKKIIPSLLPRSKSGLILPFSATGVSRLLKRFLFSDKGSLDDESFNWQANLLDEEWDAKQTSENGKDTKYKDHARPAWVECAKSCFKNLCSVQFLEENLCYEVLTKVVQLKTVLHDEGEIDRSRLVTFSMQSLLETVQVTPLMLGALQMKPVQVIIDEGIRLYCGFTFF